MMSFLGICTTRGRQHPIISWVKLICMFVHQTRTLTPDTLCFKFLCVAALIQRHSNNTRVSANFMSHAGWTKLGKKLNLELYCRSGFQHSLMVLFFHFFFYLIADTFNGLTGSIKIHSTLWEGQAPGFSSGKSGTTFLRCVSSVGCLLRGQT